MMEKITIFKENLSFKNYKERFTYLLHLELLEQEHCLTRFNMPSAVMHHKGEYLSLKVPGLAEKRPSLIVNDKIVVSFAWDSTQGNILFIIFILFLHFSSNNI